jgi:circadian clock protein KaiC
MGPAKGEKTAMKCRSGIDGLDDITEGGLPRGRTTLVYGGAGCGKTLFALQFLVNGAERYDEPGVFISFEETLDELVGNAANQHDLAGLLAKRRLYIDCVDLHFAPQQESGAFGLDALMFRMAAGIDAVGAKRIAIDCIETLFSRFTQTDIIRSELHRLHRWLKDRGITAVVTGEAGQRTLTRHGIEEYISDSVIHLDHRVTNQVATRRLRVVKMRGSGHGTNEYPYIINHTGISVLPITSLTLEYAVTDERVSSGVPRLDTMLDGNGFYRGSSVLVSGTAGTGKSSIAATFALAACQRGERALYFAFEESPQQIVRNMRSIGLDLRPEIERGMLGIRASRASSLGLEMHLSVMIQSVESFKPAVVVIDPISNLISVGSGLDVKMALTRLIDYLKQNQVTVLFTELTSQPHAVESTNSEISSLMDTWLLLFSLEASGERNRALYVLKSRGMGHSNQIRELKIGSNGLELLDVYVGAGKVLTGTARMVLESQEQYERKSRMRQLSQLQRTLAERRRQLEQQQQRLQREFENDIEALEQAIADAQAAETDSTEMSRVLAVARKKDQG